MKRYKHVGLVADHARTDTNRYDSNICIIFGIDEDEHRALASVVEIHPEEYAGPNVRYVFGSSMFMAMRVLGEKFGYYNPKLPSLSTLSPLQTLTQIITIERAIYD